MPGFSGNCLCGSVKYTSKSEPVNIMNCHCDDCRKASGATYLTNIFIPLVSFNVQGTLKKYVHYADSGSKMTKYFCINCGSQVYGENSSREGVVSIRAGSINEKYIIKPLRNVFTSSKIPSTPLDNNLEKFDKMPF